MKGGNERKCSKFIKEVFGGTKEFMRAHEELLAIDEDFTKTTSMVYLRQEGMVCEAMSAD